MKNKTTILKKLMAVVLILAAAFLLNPVGAQAAKKPGKVTKLEEVKATDTSITVKFKKVKGAKKYQVRLYEASFNWGTKKWKAKTKKLIKKLETKKTTYTIKGLEKAWSYTIKVRACNGKSYGKWATISTCTTVDGVKRPGNTEATKKNLEKQYNTFKAMFVKETKKYSPSVCDVTGYIDCTKTARGDIAGYASGSKEELLRTYKNGYGTDLEIYHVMADICEKAGVKYAIKKFKCDNPFYVFLLWQKDGKIELFEVEEGGSTYSGGKSPESIEEDYE